MSVAAAEHAEQQLVDALRMLSQAEIIDFNGHCSLRTAPDRLLINSGRSIRSHLTTADLVEITLDGERVRGTDAPPLEFHIHAAIYRRRPDVRAVVHGHPKWSTYFSMVGEVPEPVFAQGTLLGEMPLFPDPLSVNTRAAGDALAECLGDARAVLLRSHGAVVVGADIVEAFALALYLEENAQRQYMARALGRPHVFTPEQRAACRENLWKRSLFQKAWDHARARLG